MCEFEYLGKLPLHFIVCASVFAPVQEFEYLGKLPLRFISIKMPLQLR